MTATKHIRGTLVPTNKEAINSQTRDKILDGVMNYGLGLIIKDFRQDGIIDIDSYSTAFGARHSALEFIDRFISILNGEGVAELELSGTLMMTVVSDAEPVAFRLTVERGVVTVEEATLTWNRKDAIFHSPTMDLDNPARNGEKL